MKTPSNISMTGLLMVSSQLLLALFLGYWLFNQYASSKELLIDDLERGFQTAEQQIMDSALSAHIIDPFLKDSSNYTILMMDPLIRDSAEVKREFFYHEDSIPQMRLIVSGDQMDVTDLVSPHPQMRKFGVSVVDSVHFPDSTGIIVRTQTDSTDKMLLQTVKLFIKSMGEQTEMEQDFSLSISGEIDSLLFIRTYQRFLDAHYPEFDAEWNAEQIGPWARSKKDIRINSFLFGGNYGVSISDYHTYLMKSILAQLGFAFVLLLITGLAFRLAFVNLRNQRRLMAIKNDFISNITHELKTPVSTVKVALEALLDFNMKDDPKRTKEYLEMANNEMNRLDLLVNQVLTNSALEENKSFIVTENIDLISLINEVVLSMQSRIDHQNASIIFEPQQSTLVVNVDKLHIFGVLVNLIDNGLKYNEGKAKIDISVHQRKLETSVTISDNGIGIPPEFLDKVFDKFFRVPKGDSHNIKGYGLGLNYASLVMAQHKGSIILRNREGGGCSFTINIPN